MKEKHFFKHVCLCALLLCASTACIDTRYDMSKISMKMAVGGDSLSIPLISGGAVYVGTALETFVEDSIKELKTDSVNGGYKFEISDVFSYTLDSSAKADMGLDKIGMEDQVFAPDPITVEGIDASATQITIEGIKQTEVIELGIEGINVKDFAMPQLALEEKFTTELGGYLLSDEQRNITPSPVNIEYGKLLGDASLPPALEAFANNLPHEEIPLILPSNTLDINMEEAFSVSVSTPDGINSIDDIVLQKSPKPASMTLSIRLENAAQFLTSGELIPAINVLPSSIFTFAANQAGISGGKIVFNENDALTQANKYSLSKTFTIESLNIGGDIENGKLNVEQMVSAEGSITAQNIKYYADEITKIKNLAFKLDVIFNDIVVESLSLDIAGKSTEVSGENALDISNSLPEQIAGIRSIIAEDNSRIDIQILGDKNLAGLQENLSLENFRISFPKAIRFVPQEGLDQQTNVFSLDNKAFNPAQGLSLSFVLDEVNMNEIPVNDCKIEWQDKISYSGELKVQGKINSASLPESVELGVKIDSDLKLKDIIATTNKIEHKLDNINIEFKEEVASPLDELVGIKTATLKEGCFINIDLSLPKLPLPLMAENIRISLPKMMEFASHPLLDNNNVLGINGTIPENIKLELKKLNINKDFVDGVMSIDENIQVEGAISVIGGELSANALSEALQENIEVRFELNDMTLADIGASIKGISYQLCDSIAFEESIEIPQEVLRVDSLILSQGASIDIELLAENLPDFDAPITLNVNMDLPDMFMFESEEIKASNIWRFQTEIESGKSICKHIDIRGLDLSGFDLSSGLVNLNEQIKYDVNVYLAGGDINSGDLSNEPIKVSTKAEIKGLNLERIYGVIDPKIEEISESISMADLPDFLKDSTMARLEINPVITLSAKSNISIPLVINGELMPVNDGIADETRGQSIHLELPKAASTEEVKEHHFWIAASDADMPQGYQFAQLDVNNILKSIPDELSFKLNVGTDTQVQHAFDLSADYSADLEYKVSVPIAFGQNSYFSLKDTLELDLEEIGSYFNYVGDHLELYGEIENAIPLKLVATLTAIDENGESIDMEPIALAIKPGNRDGSANVSPVSVKIDNKNHQLDKARAFVLDFRLSADADVANTPISPDNYIQAKLKIRAVGGIVVDLNEL